MRSKVDAENICHLYAGCDRPSAGSPGVSVFGNESIVSSLRQGFLLQFGRLCDVAPFVFSVFLRLRTVFWLCEY